MRNRGCAGGAGGGYQTSVCKVTQGPGALGPDAGGPAPLLPGSPPTAARTSHAGAASEILTGLDKV